jgi:hypothetical protein
MAFLLALTQPARAAEEAWTYTIVRGDTLIGLRNRLMRPEADWRELQRLNGIRNPRRLKPGSTLRVPRDFLPQIALEVEVVQTHGQATLRRKGQAEQALASGLQLTTGDIVATGALSSATLRFADGTRVLLRPDSVLRIERSVREAHTNRVSTQLQLDEGAADSRVPKPASAQTSSRFEIRTPVVNLGVRGTQFRTRTDSLQTTVEVLEGVVAALPAGLQTVTAGFGARATAGSEAGTGRISAPTPLAGAPALIGLPTRIERLPLQLRWQAPADALFRAQVFATESTEGAEGTDVLLLDGLFSGGLARWNADLPDGKYRLLVRSVGANGIEGLDQPGTFTLKARPEPPYVAFPADGARLLAGPVVFSWARPTQAGHYHLQLSASPDFAQPLLDRNDLVGTEARVELPLGKWHWRLASVRADGDQGPWSDTLAVTGLALPPPPEGEPPQLTSEGVLLRWRERAAARYQVQVAADPGFTRILFDEHVSAPQWLLPKPGAGTYHVRVRVTDADGFVGPYGDLQQVEVPHSKWWWLLLVPLLAVI